MEVFIKVMILKEHQIFMCLAALLYEQFLPTREWRCQDIDQVLIQFDEYDGPSIFENRPKCVPICPVTITSLQLVMERRQLPLKLAWALTIQKSQSLTLPKPVIDLGKSERTRGISYVTISRVKIIVIVSNSANDIRKIANYKIVQEEQRLDLIAQQTFQFNMYTLFQFIYSK